MTEEEAQAILRSRYGVSRETMDKLAAFRKLLFTENKVQNLIASSTEHEFWARHILDSVQIVDLVPDGANSWLDVGTGAGLPGLVLVPLTQAQHHLVEPRKRRAEFLRTAARTLGVSLRVEVIAAKVELVRRAPVHVITARAFASLNKTLAATYHLGDENTVWVLNKGRRAAAELEEAQSGWAGEFCMHSSVTDVDASLVTVANVRPRNST